MAKAKAKAKPKKGTRASAAASEFVDSSQEIESGSQSLESSPSKSNVSLSQRSDLSAAAVAAAAARPPGSTKPSLIQHRRYGMLQQSPKKMLESARNRFEDLLMTISRDGEEDYDFHDSDDDMDTARRVKSVKRKSTSASGASTAASSNSLLKPKTEGKTDSSQTDSATGKANQFILKLFERSVDLAQFGTVGSNGDDVPLYPVCRAWIKNDPNATTFRLDPSVVVLPDDASDDGLDMSPNHTGSVSAGAGTGFGLLGGYGLGDRPSGIYRLPEPSPRLQDDDGNDIDMRIPYVEKPTRDTVNRNLDKILKSSEPVATRSTVMESSLLRWKRIREDWRDAAAINENRYKHSLDVLKAMYARTIDEPDYDSMIRQSEI